MSDLPLSALDDLPLPIEPTDNFYAVRANKSYKVDASALQTFLTTEINIDDTAFLNANSTPIEIIPAQGIGTYINPTFAVLTNNADGTTAYSVLGTLEINHAGAPKEIFDFDVAIGAALAKYKENAIYKGQRELLENAALEFSATVGNPTLGDHTFTLKVWYTIET